MKRLFYAVALSAACAFSACTDEGGTNPITVSDKAELKQTLSAGETSGTVTFTAAEPWAANVQETTKAAPTWITLDKYNGEAGTVTLAITLEPNETDAVRTATITIACASGKITITVKQEGAGAIADKPITITDASELEEDIPAEGASRSITFTAKEDWTATLPDAPSWLSLDKTSGKAGTFTLGITAVPNNLGSERSATVYIAGKKGSAAVSLTQQGVPVGKKLLVKRIYSNNETTPVSVDFTYDNEYRVTLVSINDYEMAYTYSENTITLNTIGTTDGSHYQKIDATVTLDVVGRIISGEATYASSSYAPNYDTESTSNWSVTYEYGIPKEVNRTEVLFDALKFVPEGDGEPVVLDLEVNTVCTFAMTGSDFSKVTTKWRERPELEGGGWGAWGNWQQAASTAEYGTCGNVANIDLNWMFYQDQWFNAVDKCGFNILGLYGLWSKYMVTKVTEEDAYAAENSREYTFNYVTNGEYVTEILLNGYGELFEPGSKSNPATKGSSGDIRRYIVEYEYK